MRQRAVCFAALALLAASSRSQENSTFPTSRIDPALREILRSAISEVGSFDDRFEAEVWLTDMSQRLANQVPDVNERLHILRTVHHEATRTDLAPELILAVIEVESNFDRFAISSSSALGLMQIMPFWVEELGGDHQSDLFNIEYNVLLGTRILKYYLDREGGELIRALGRYNGSLGRRDYADRVIEVLRTKWFRA